MYRRFIGIKCSTLTISYKSVRIGQNNSNPTLRILVSRVPKLRRRRITLANVRRQNGIEISFKSTTPERLVLRSPQVHFILSVRRLINMKCSYHP